MFLGNSPLLPRVSLLEGVGGTVLGGAGLSPTGEDGGVSGAGSVATADWIQMSLVASSLLMKETDQSALERLLRPSL